MFSGVENMKLPKWNLLKANYPASDAGTVFTNIGGKVAINYNIGVFSNACATRVSQALNGVGGVHKVKYFKDTSPNGNVEAQVSSGKNKNWYIFRVKMLVKYLKDKYSKPEIFTSSNYKTELAGRKGIIVYVVSGWSDATGHADLWDGSKCLWQDYGTNANEIFFWEAS